MSIGSGIGLTAIPIIISDFLLLNLTKKRKFYQGLKEYDYKEKVDRIEIIETKVTTTITN